MVLYVLG